MSTNAVQSVGVFCGASEGTSPEYKAAALEAGRLIAVNGLRLVYGGGGGARTGMMCATADGCLNHGGMVTGVIPEFLMGMEKPHPRVSDMRVVETMAERKRVLIEESDAFLILAGGIGTLDELFEVMTCKQLKLVNKPVLIVNTLGCYDGLKIWYDRAVQDQFVPANGGGVPLFAQTPQEALDLILSQHSKPALDMPLEEIVG